MEKSFSEPFNSLSKDQETAAESDKQLRSAVEGVRRYRDGTSSTVKEFWKKFRHRVAIAGLAAGLSLAAFAAQDVHAASKDVHVTAAPTIMASAENPTAPEQEGEVPSTLKAFGTSERLPGHPIREALTLHLSNLLEGEQPLIEAGEGFNVLFTLENEVPQITQIAVPLADIVGPELAGDAVFTFDLSKDGRSQTVSGEKLVEIISQQPGVVLSDELKQQIQDNYLVSATVSGRDKDITIRVYMGANATQAQQIQIVVNRFDTMAEGTVVGKAPDVKASNVRVVPDTSPSASVPEVVFAPQMVVTVAAGQPSARLGSAQESSPGVVVTTNPSEFIPATPTSGESNPSAAVTTSPAAEQSTAPVGGEAPRIVKIEVQSESVGGVSSTESGGASSGVESSSKWHKEWAANETVPVRQWWDDMVSKGYISVSQTAWTYAGARINQLLDGMDLVPNPQEYWSTGRGGQGLCSSVLRDLASQSQGHIQVRQGAYDNIPGGAENCQVFSNH